MGKVCEIVVARERRSWTIYSPELPGRDFQVRRIADIRSVAVDEIASALGVEADSLTVHVSQIHIPTFGDIAGEVRELEQLRAAVADLEARATSRTAAFTKKLTSVDIPVRDIAELLDISPQRVSQISNTEPVETIDASLWMRRSRWAQHTRLNAGEVEAVTGLSIGAFKGLVGESAGTPGGPQGDTRDDLPVPDYRFDDDGTWPAATTLRFVLTRLPHRADKVPRLFPRIPDPPAAVFEGSLRLNVAAVGDFAVHLWRPGDGGPLVGVAYADRNVRHLEVPDKVVGSLLEQLDHQVGAVAMHNHEAASVRVLRKDGTGFEPREADQPCLVVADRETEYRPDPVAESTVSRYWWTDLVNLLRVNLPWWPDNLQELGAMLAWRPWTPVQEIVPGAPNMDPRNITGLASIADPAEVRQALEQQAKLCLHRLATSATPDPYNVTPGLMFAALSAIDHRVAAPQLSVHDKHAILHHRTSQDRFAAMSLTTSQWDFMPIFTYGMRLHPVRSGPLARQWISRLVDVPEDRHDEVGFWKLQDYVRGPDPIRWMTDPHTPDSWILQQSDGTLTASVGTCTPNAIGTLTSAEIDKDAAFFTDSSGAVWPIPDAGFTYYRTGYDGSGPLRLAETITTLLVDARADVHDPGEDAPSEELHKLLMTAESPLTVPPELLTRPLSTGRR